MPEKRTRKKSSTGARKKRSKRIVETPEQTAQRHFQLGWWMIFLFVSMGILLEAFHAFKIGWYLNVDQKVRRLLLLTGHGFGAVMGVFHVGFAATCLGARHWKPRSRTYASACLTASGLLIPAGFVLAGVFQRSDGSPGMGIALVLMGAVLCVLAIANVAVGARTTVGLATRDTQP